MGLYEKSKAKKIVSKQEDIKATVLSSIDQMATIVGATLGPGGRAVLIERDNLAPLITKDGVTVAKALGVDKADSHVIIEACKEICINTAKQAGDGTTTAIVLANAFVKHGQKFLANNPKYNPQKLVRELQEAYETVVVPYLKDHAVKVSTAEQLKNVAKISANGDEKIASIVVEAVNNAGDDGTVLISEAQGDVMRVETLEGFIVTSGLKELGQIGPVFMNDRSNQQIKMDNAIVFLYDGSINDLKVTGLIQEAIEQTELEGLPIILFAHDFADIVLDRLAKNVKGGITIAPIKTPMSALPNSRSEFLRDMAAYTGASIFDPGNLEDLDEDGFGKVESAKVNMFESVIIGGADPEALDARIGELEALLSAAKSEYDRMFIKAAIAKLTGGICTIWVGGSTDLEIREKKDRVEDAVEAVKSAIAEGIIPGGCSVQLQLANVIRYHKRRKPSWEIMANALEEPINLLLTNAGEDPEEIKVLLKRYTKGKQQLPKRVFDALEHRMVNPFKAGIIEPAKVCRVALNNALSVTSLLTTLGGMVVVPRDSQLESQLAMSEKAFKQMMSQIEE